MFRVPKAARYWDEVGVRSKESFTLVSAMQKRNPVGNLAGGCDLSLSTGKALSRRDRNKKDAVSEESRGHPAVARNP